MLRLLVIALLLRWVSLLLLRIRRLVLRMRLIMLRIRAGGAADDGLVEPLPDRNSGAARGFPCGVADFRPHTFHVPRGSLPHALTHTQPAETDP